MNIENISFPHPVLGNHNDFKESPTEIRHEVEETKDEFLFAFEYTLNNTKLEVYLEQGWAEIVCEIQCPRTMLRHTQHFSETAFSLSIPKSCVAQRVKITNLIVSTRTEENYSNDGFNDDLAGFIFAIDPGDVLGILGCYTYDVDIEYSRLQAVDSIIQIVPDRDSSRQTIYTSLGSSDVGNKKIEIHFPQSIYDNYVKNVVGQDVDWENTLRVSLLMNSLLLALADHKGRSDKRLWARAIQTRIDSEPELEHFAVTEEGIIGDIEELAQLLLGNPYSTLFAKED